MEANQDLLMSSEGPGNWKIALLWNFSAGGYVFGTWLSKKSLVTNIPKTNTQIKLGVQGPRDSGTLGNRDLSSDGLAGTGLNSPPSS